MEFPWRAVRLFLLLAKHCFEEKTMMPGGGGWRDCVSGFVYTPGMTFGDGCTRSSWAASNGADGSLISWISFPGGERGAPLSQDVLKVTSSPAVGTHDCQCKMCLLCKDWAAGSSRGELWWAGCDWLLEVRGHRFPFPGGGREPVLCLLFPVFH